VLHAAHPSPHSARRGFLGCRHFSKANAYLLSTGAPEIDWALPLIGAELPTGAPEIERALPPVGEEGAGAPAAKAAAPPVPAEPPLSRQAQPEAVTLTVPPTADTQPAPPGAVARNAAPAVTTARAPPSAGALATSTPSTSGRYTYTDGAPDRWREQLEAIREARAERTAPVDFLGCHTLGKYLSIHPFIYLSIYL